MRSNYELAKERAREYFLKYDQNEIISKLPIRADGNYLRFSFFESDCRVERSSGRVECFNPLSGTFQDAEFNEALTVYDLLCNSQKGAVPFGEYISISGLSRLQSATWNGTLNTEAFQSDANRFDHSREKLCAALIKMGASFVSGGDLGAEIPFFGPWSVLFRFWASDDEFEAKIQCMWDRCILSMIQYETVWYATGVFMNRLRRYSGS